MDTIPRVVSPSALELVGLSETERMAYEALVDRGPVTKTELATALSGSAGRLTRTLKELEGKGLVSRVPGRPARFAAVPPEVGLELLFAQREEELRRARLAAAGLAERFHDASSNRGDASGLIEIVNGERAVADRYSAVHRMARQNLRVMSRPPYVMSTQETLVITEESHDVGVRVRNVIDPRYLDAEEREHRLANIRADIAAGEEYRVIPSVPLKLIIADDRAALIPLEIRRHGIESAALFHASALLDALVEVFETCWGVAYSLDIGPEDEDILSGLGSVSPDERELLTLLAAGIPDGAIARQLGLSNTTAQRRIRALKERLGATTRFQAGLQAALRGWISDERSSNEVIE